MHLCQIEKPFRLIKFLNNKAVNYQNEFKSKNEEISILRQITHRLNIELSAYQARYPSGLLQASLKKKEITGLPPRGPIPIWLVRMFIF